MKTDYKVGDWVEVLYDNAEGALVNARDRFLIVSLADNNAYVRSDAGCRLRFNHKSIKLVETSPRNQSILSKAEAIISGQRQTVNGKPERSFEQIAARWSLTVGTKITAQQVALMMVDMKMVRALQGVTTEGHDDHFVDMAGYVALAAELGSNNEIS